MLDARSATAALLGDGSAAIDLVSMVQYFTDIEILEHRQCTSKRATAGSGLNVLVFRGENCQTVTLCSISSHRDRNK